MNDEILAQIVEGDLQTLWNLLCVYKDEARVLNDCYLKVKNGIHIDFHINHLLQKNQTERVRSGEVWLLGNSYAIEEFWEEEEARATAARKALLEHFDTDDGITEAR